MRTINRHTEAAFTLLEILLVIIIIGVVSALAVPNFTKGLSGFQLNKTSDDLLSMGRWAQAMAIGQSRIYELSFSDDKRSYNMKYAKLNPDPNDTDLFEPVNGSMGRMHTVPDVIHIDVDKDNIQFYPDGTIDEATIKLSSSDHQLTLSTTAVRGLLTKVNNE